MRKIFLLVLVLVSSVSCEDDCKDILCTTPPETFRFEFVDMETGVNLFTNGTYAPGKLIITNLDNGLNVSFNFIVENDLNIIELDHIGWQTEIINYSIQFPDQLDFIFYVDAEAVIEDCCAFTRMNEVSIEGIDYERDPSNGVFRILVE